MKRIITLALSAVLLLCLTACGNAEERTTYKEAVEQYEAGNYTSALKLFEEIPDYKDSDDYIRDCRYYTAMQTVSPDSSLEDGYSGRVADCTADNVTAYSKAVTILQELDGYSDSNRMRKDAEKKLEQYNSENRILTIVSTLEDQFLGYASRCEYDGVEFTIYFSDSYPLTYEVVQRGRTETAVLESWGTVRTMFTSIVFEYLPDCTVTLIDRNGDTLGTYRQGETHGEVTVVYDVASKPY